ncbi:MAG: hypothetical protein QOD28_300 [Acidobacteriota bacterium]|nr:hypothetical protein [Acidobacteriota bacterium]
MVVLLLGASAFVAAGIWILSLDGASIRSRRGGGDPIYVHALGLVTIVFFGIFAIYALKKLLDKKPALVFNDSGIVDNVSSASAGFIPWSDVIRAEIFELPKHKMLVIKVRDPQKYVARGSSLRRSLNKTNYKTVGSPISIYVNLLEIDVAELASLFKRYQRKYGVGAGSSGDMRHPLLWEDARPTETLEGHAGQDDGDFIRTDVEPEAQLLNWSSGALIATVGSGGIGIFVLAVSSLDMLFHIQIPFWAGMTVSLLPVFVFFLAVPDSRPRSVVRPAQWFAAVWYLVCAALSLSLTAYRGFEAAYFILAGVILLGAWPCLVAVRKLLVVHET